MREELIETIHNAIWGGKVVTASCGDDARRRAESAKIADAVLAFLAERAPASGEPVKWQLRRADTMTGEWLHWVDCTREAFEEVNAGQWTEGKAKYEARALYAAPPSQPVALPDGARERMARAAVAWVAAYDGSDPNISDAFSVALTLVDAMIAAAPAGGEVGK